MQDHFKSFKVVKRLLLVCIFQVSIFLLCLEPEPIERQVWFQEKAGRRLVAGETDVIPPSLVHVDPSFARDLENLMASSGASGPPREGSAIQWLMQHLTTMELAPGYVKRAIKEHQEMSFKLHEKERELKQMQERCECFLVSHSYFSAVWKSKGSISQLVIAFIEIAM